jgi:phospholipid transport system transporter-binding protein
VNLRLSPPSASQPHACLSIIGELDQTTLVQDYWDMLPDSDKKNIIASGQLKVDLSEVERSDTAGLAWLINLVKHAKAKKVKVSFKSVPDKLLNLANLSGAKNILSQ